jgi:outer membrane protein assembly factor BamB
MKHVVKMLVGLVLAAAVVRDGWSDDWPQFRGPQRDGVWREQGIVDRLPPTLNVRWRQPVALGYAGPAVADGRVYLMDYVPPNESQDSTTEQQKSRGAQERVTCFDAATGTRLWQYAYPCLYKIDYPSGPRATPTVDGDRVYTVGAMGELTCLNAERGIVVWRKNYVQDFGTEMNAWGMAAAPFLDGEKLIVVVGGHPSAAVVALEKRTGKELWRSLEVDDPGYCVPSMIQAGATRQLIVWLPDALNSLDPETGQPFWRQEFKIRFGMTIATPTFDPQRNLLFASAFYDGPLMMQLSDREPSARVLWRRDQGTEREPDGLHCLMCTPHMVDGYLYGICSYGHLRCINMKSGEQEWETLQATGEGRWWNAFLIRHEDRFFIVNEQGDLIIARLTPEGYTEISRSFLIEPTNQAQRRSVVWSHPAFANRCVYARNDKQLICVDLATR